MTGPILITGVAGFLGRHVAHYFSRQGLRVIGTDLAGEPPSGLHAYQQLALPNPGFRALLHEHQPKAVIHCAGCASVPQSMREPAEDFRQSVVLTFELLEELRRTPTCRFLFLSSAAVYGNPAALPVREQDAPAPLSPYGFHKLQCEQLCAEFATVYGLPTASARIFSAYGPGLRRQVVWDICVNALSAPTVRLQGTGAESRDFIHADDVAAGLFAIAKRAPLRGETYNLASGREATIAELAKLALAALEIDKRVECDGVTPQGNPRNWRADITKIASLGFAPMIPLKQGIEEVARWARAEIVGRRSASHE